MNFKLSTEFSEKIEVLNENGEIDRDRLLNERDSKWRREIDRLLRVDQTGHATSKEQEIINKINKAIWEG